MVSPNVALTTDAYVPILKSKRAELDAIGGCTKDRLVPLLEVVDPVGAAAAISRVWQGPNQIWVQALNAEGQDDSEFAPVVDDLFAALRHEAVTSVPVITATEEPLTLGVVASVVRTDGRGVVIRLDVEDLIDEAINMATDVESTVASLGLARSEVDIVVDAGLLSGSVAIQAAVAGQAVHALPALNDWRSVVVAFSAFPSAIGEVAPRESVTAISRADASAFMTVRPGIGRPVVFADYAIGVPTYGGAPFTPIPNMRYTSDTDWLVHRAKERKAPSPQYRALASGIVSAPYYSGASFSIADQQISDIADGSAGPGNATTHLRIGMSRHIHVVLERLATLGEP